MKLTILLATLSFPIKLHSMLTKRSSKKITL
jgi:hypothetical protein